MDVGAVLACLLMLVQLVQRSWTYSNWKKLSVLNQLPINDVTLTLLWHAKEIC